MQTSNQKIKVQYVPISSLEHVEYNPRLSDKETLKPIITSIKKHGMLDPLIVNKAPNRKFKVIGGNVRLEAAKKIGFTEVPVIFVNIPNLEKEKDLCLRLNKAVGAWDFNLLAQFDESFLNNVGFSSEEIDEIFPTEDTPEIFNLDKELKKLQIDKIEIEKGDVWEIGDVHLGCGDSTVEADILRLMDGEKADMCFTDSPYLLDYLKGKTKQKDGVTVGFGAKKNRRYLETDVLPDNFTELWMGNIAKVQKPDFSIIAFENPKNLKTIWTELEKHWKYRNTIIWHIPNRMQGFSAKYKFFNKYDFAIVGTSGEVKLDDKPEAEPLFQEEYETALFATSGKPTWEGYEKGKKVCPTDFIEHIAADEKSSGQGIIFGTKPIELLIPYIKVLTKRGDLIIEPFGGSGSTAVATLKLGRRCYINEKSPVYAEIIRRRIEQLTGLKAKRIKHHGTK